MEKYSDFKISLRGLFFLPAKGLYALLHPVFFLRDFFEKKKGAALKISELRLTNEFP